VMAVRQNGPPTLEEVSSTIGGMEAVTFHDQTSQMTVVWLQDNTPASAANIPVQDPVLSPDRPVPVSDM
jgi:hypothetical protein